jgi:hypothetical protein
MGIEGDSMLSPTLINCNFVKPAKGLRFHPIRTNYPASAQGITAAIFIVAFKKDDGTLSAGRVGSSRRCDRLRRRDLPPMSARQGARRAIFGGVKPSVPRGWSGPCTKGSGGDVKKPGPLRGTDGSNLPPSASIEKII